MELLQLAKKTKILESPKINTDDTPIPVKSRRRRGSTYRGYSRIKAVLEEYKAQVLPKSPIGDRLFSEPVGGVEQVC